MSNKYLDIALEKIIKQEVNAVLDKIRAEIASLDYLNITDGSDGYDKYINQYDALQIIDKYKGDAK